MILVRNLGRAGTQFAEVRMEPGRTYVVTHGKLCQSLKPVVLDCMELLVLKNSIEYRRTVQVYWHLLR
jgi:hypothetical protein